MVLPVRLIGVARFGEPGRISATIRFFRYFALGCGIFYGASRARFLQNRADRLKPLRDKKKAERLAREAQAKIDTEKTSLTELENVLGTKMY